EGSGEDRGHVTEAWMDGELAESTAHADMPKSVSPLMYIGANGRWGYSLLHLGGVIMELTIQDGRAGNEYLLMADVLPEFTRDSPQTFSRFDGIIFSRVFGE